MSSRWISTSLSRPATPLSRLIAACAAFTSDDLPMPRAPHRSALLAGRARAKRWVFSTRRSRTRSTPRRSARSTRLTRRTGASAPLSARQTKASAASKSGARRSGGRERARAPRRCGGGGRLGSGAATRGNPVRLEGLGFATRTGQAPALAACAADLTPPGVTFRPPHEAQSYQIRSARAQDQL